VTQPLRVAVTGAGGFIGRAVVKAARERGHTVVAVVRSAPEHSVYPEGVEIRAVGDLAGGAAQEQAVERCDAVIHLAGRVRIPKPDRARAAEILRQSNAVMAAGLADAAARAGCRRFVFASSFSVYGAATAEGAILTEDSPLAPVSAYGASKRDAEAVLSEVAARTGLSLIVLRPPAVFGPGAASPFALLVNAVRLGLPLPLAMVKNSRSFIYVDNLADAFVAAAESEACGAFVVTDSAPVSSAGMVTQIAQAMSRRSSLVPMPVGLMRAAARTIGAGAVADSLLGSMAADGSRFMRATGWTPRVPVEEALARTVRASQR